MASIPQNTTYTRMFLMVSSTDHISAGTGASPTVNISKAGAAFGAAAGTVTEISGGWYKVALTTADTNTLGDLAFHITGTGVDATDFSDQVVVPANVRTGTCQSGSTSSTVVLDASASATNNIYQDCLVFLYGGTGAGQVRSIQSYTGSSQTATIFPNWTTTPDSTSLFVILPAGQADVGNWLNGTIPTVNVTGVPKVDLVDISGSGVSTSTAQLGVNVVQYNGQTAATDSNNLPKVDVEDWKGTAVPSPNVAGYPLVDTVKWVGGVIPAVNVTGVPKVDLVDVSGSAVSTTSAQIGVNVVNYNGQAAQTDANNLPKVDLEDWKGAAPNSLNAGRVDAVASIRSGTAQAGAAGSITLDSGASATNSFYNDDFVLITGGTGVGQVRLISGYTGSSKVATVTPNWATNPDNTSTFTIIPHGYVDLGEWLGSAPNALQSGRVDSYLGATGAVTVTANVTQWNGSNVVAPNVAGIPVVDVTKWVGGTVPAPNVTGVPKIDVVDISGSAVSTTSAQIGVNVVQYNAQTAQTDANNLPKVDLEDWKGTAPNALVSGRVDTSVGAIVSGVAAADIWNAARSTYTAAGSFGLALNAYVIRDNTAAAGAAGSITLDASASATNDFYKGRWITITAGTGVGQARLCTGYVGSTQVASIAPNWATTPDNTSKFAILPAAGVDLELWGASAPNALISGRVDANTQATAASLSFNLTGSITGNLSGSVGSVTGAVGSVTAVVSANVTQWNGHAVPAENVNGVPLVDVKYTLGTLSAGAAGYVGLDWGQITNKTTANALTGTTISSSQVVASVSGAVGSVTAAVTVGTNNDKTGYSLAANDSPVIQSGIAQAGGGSTITLAAGASATDSLYVGQTVKLTGGTGAGQVRVIAGYVGSTKVATVDRAWQTNPDATSTYAVLATDAPKTDSSLNVTANAASVFSVNVTQWNGSAPNNLISGRVDVNAGVVGDKTGYSLTQAFPANFSSLAISSGGNVTVGGYASGQDPATLVLDVAASSHNTAATIGAKINAAGSSSDPLANAVPGSYAAGTAGYVLGNMVSSVWSAASRTLTAFGFSVTVGTNNDKTGYALTSGEHANIQTDAYAAVAQGLGTDTISELAQGQPAATPTLKNAIMLVYMALRNQGQTSVTQLTVCNSSGVVICKAPLSDDGTTFTRAIMVSGP